MSELTEAEALDIISSLEAEKAAEADHDDEPVDGLSPEAQDKEKAAQDEFEQNFPAEMKGAEAKQQVQEDDGKCTDEDFKELGELFTTLLPDKQYAMGSTEARNLITDSKAVKGIFTRIRNLSTEEVADLKLFLRDKISDMKAEAKHVV